MPFVAELIFALFVLFGLMAVYTVAATWWVERAHPPIGDFIMVQGLRLHYVAAGNGPSIVLLHGVSTSLVDFDANILRDLARDHHVIAFDRPGYGYSDRPVDGWPDPARQAALIREALRILRIDRPLIVGHSWSGSVVLAYLLNHPKDAAGGILLAGAVESWEGGVNWYVDVTCWPVIGRLFSSTLALPLGQMLLNSAIDDIFAPEPPTPDYRSRTSVDLSLRPGTFRASSEDMCNLNDFLRAQSPRYEQIDSPLLLITGERDTVVPAWNHADALAARLPDARRVDLPGAGHALHHSRATEVLRLIRDFVR